MAAAHWAAAALLIAVALNQIRLAGFDGTLTPAKGGGFGLFSTVDKLANRTLFAFAIEEEGEWLIRYRGTPRFAQDLRNAKSQPTPEQLGKLAKALAKELDGVPLTALRIEVWKRVYDAQDQQARRVKVAELVVPEANLARD